MSQKRDSIASLLTTVVFLVLIAITAVLYNGDHAGKAEMENNIVWQKANVAWEFVKDLVFSPKTAAEKAGSIQEAVNTAQTDLTEPGFLMTAVSRIKDEWHKGSDDNDESSDLDTSRWPVSLERTPTGATVVYREKEGTEHRLPLPFGLLSE